MKMPDRWMNEWQTFAQNFDVIFLKKKQVQGITMLLATKTKALKENLTKH